jgi:hypothetical protein
MAPKPYTIRAWANPGIYGTDDQGNPWATFHCINHTVACHTCGKAIDRGWMRGRFGEEQIHVCSEHVEAVFEVKQQEVGKF